MCKLHKACIRLVIKIYLLFFVFFSVLWLLLKYFAYKKQLYTFALTGHSGSKFKSFCQNELYLCVLLYANQANFSKVKKDNIFSDKVEFIFVPNNWKQFTLLFSNSIKIKQADLKVLCIYIASLSQTFFKDTLW